MDRQDAQPEHVADKGLGGPVEETIPSVGIPRADATGEEVIRQPPVDHGQALGGGEFPNPDAFARGPESLRNAEAPTRPMG